jgi:hypothetical protein
MTTWRCFWLGLLLFTAGAALGGSAVLAWQQAQAVPPAPEPVAEAHPLSWEATLYLPLIDNRSKPFPEEEWLEAINVLVRRFEGATLGEQREGYWLDHNRRVHREPVRPVVISFDRHRLGEFRQTVREVGRRLGQECMYVRLEQPRVELIAVLAESVQKEP